MSPVVGKLMPRFFEISESSRRMSNLSVSRMGLWFTSSRARKPRREHG